MLGGEELALAYLLIKLTYEVGIGRGCRHSAPAPPAARKHFTFPHPHGFGEQAFPPPLRGREEHLTPRRRYTGQTLIWLSLHGDLQPTADALETRPRYRRRPNHSSHRANRRTAPPSRVPSILSTAHVFHLSIPASADLSAAGPARKSALCWPQSCALVLKEHRETMLRARPAEMAGHGGRSELLHPLLLPQIFSPSPGRSSSGGATATRGHDARWEWPYHLGSGPAAQAERDRQML
ncbi:hypothetical protein M433DRAFT_810 [Acidomyces richmondensis BFW]|nr:MAG: hypothetical protein FE78DRAFT_32437 [Acidomyces sp. 'richmondensis']KYG49765.1 hypothetical protein M433DRAFT_810 [Acidomyces richmondensis BFW]